jgi:SAM-dependent methyltransferase
MLSRQKGPLYKTKVHHNNVKHRLYEQFTKSGSSLIDIGCGKGGDLHKWEHLGIRSVLAVDISPSHIKEAKMRLIGKRTMNTRVTFLEADAFRDDIASRDGQVYDAMSCMFGLHYASRDESSINRAFQNASSSLKPGGVFFGVCADGDMVIKGGNISNEIIRIIIRPDPSEKWGRAYEFSLLDSMVSEKNVEYITRSSDLIQVAALHDLVPISLSDCADWKMKDGHTFPNLIGTNEQSINERKVSSMYFVFAFVRL